MWKDPRGTETKEVLPNLVILVKQRESGKTELKEVSNVIIRKFDLRVINCVGPCCEVLRRKPCI